MRDHQDLDRQASRQHGLLTRTQLLELGFTSKQIRVDLAVGRLARVHRGVFRLAGAPGGWEQDVMAAVLAAGRGAVATHRSALRLWGLRTVDDGIELAVPRRRAPTVRGAVVHRSVDLEGAERTTIDGVPTTTPARTLIDAGLVLPEPVVGRLVNHALATQLVKARDLYRWRWQLSRKGRTGVGIMHRLLATLPPDGETAESGPEIEVRAVLRSAGLPDPVVQHLVVVGGHRFRLDLAYVDERVAIEYDGREAHGSDRFDSDRWRHNLLVGWGWTVLHVTHEMLRHRSDELVDLIGRHLGRASVQGCGPRRATTLHRS